MSAATNRSLRALWLSFVLIVSAIAASGFLTHLWVARAFAALHQVRELQVLSDQALKEQLDEETGIRGYTSTRDRQFLQPYDQARAVIGPSLDALAAGLRDAGLDQAASEASDAQTLHEGWERRVATPLRTTPRGDKATQRLGKSIIDEFRTRLRAIDATLDKRTEEVDVQTREGVGLIDGLTTLIVLGVGLAALLIARAQRRAELRLEAARHRAEAQSRRAAELQSAYLAEKRIADLLQEAIAQHPLPALTSLRFSATYVPASEESRVGGDWYDALELPDQRVLLAIGDVVGHGVEAAVTMSRTRQTLSASALIDTDPAQILHKMNQELLRQKAPIVTVVVGYADPVTYEFVFASAGHPPPVLIEPNRKPRMLECTGISLGVTEDARYETQRIQSVPGAMLILYTDGVIEHSRDVLEGERLLLEAAERVAGVSDGDDPAAAIHDFIFKERTVGDDVAILTVGFPIRPRAGVSISAEDAQNSFTVLLGRDGKEPDSVRLARERVPRRITERRAS